MRRNDQLSLTALEKRSAAGLVAVYGVRMLGLFLILPVFALYAQTLEGVTPTLIGVAIGIYGLPRHCCKSHSECSQTESVASRSF